MSTTPDPIDELIGLGVKLRSYSHGDYYTTCPQCSSSRKRHKHAKCLSVKIDELGWVVHCHHSDCGWIQHNAAQRKTPQGARTKGPKPRHTGGYADLQRQALARWVRRT